MVNTEVRADVPTIVTAGRTLAVALVEYRSKPTNPECLWNFQEAHWGLNRFAMGLPKSDVVISNVPYTEDQMKKFMGVSRFRKVSNPGFALFLPEVASTAPEGLLLLSKVYPQMKWELQVIEQVKNEDKEGNLVNLFGWMRTEKVIDAPHTSTNEEQAEQAIGVGRKGQTLNVYGEAGNQSKMLTGKYSDQTRTLVRILNSRVRGQVVGASFDPHGGCGVYWPLESDNADDYLGVRSVGV